MYFVGLANIISIICSVALQQLVVEDTKHIAIKTLFEGEKENFKQPWGRQTLKILLFI